MMERPFSEKSLTEMWLIQLMLDRFLSGFDTTESTEIRRIALLGHLHALQAGHTWLKGTAQQAVSLLDKQCQLANVVVSQGGLNEAARTFLRNGDFDCRLRASPAFAQWPTIDTPSSLEFIGPHDDPFDPSCFFPCVVGSGRLAAAFLAGFQRLGVPNRHITIISRSPLTPTASLATWLRTLLGCEPDLEAYNHFGFDDNPVLTQPGPVFLLVKRKPFEDPHRRAWLQTFKERNRFPVMINLMAGGALDPSDEQELVIRANVLVSQPRGGNLVCHQPQMKGKAWQSVMPVLCAMGNLFPVDNQALQAKLTFFTSTVPLVFLTEIDRVCYRDLPVEHVNRLVLRTWAERYHTTQALLEGQNYAPGPVDPILEAAALRYMEIYLTKA